MDFLNRENCERIPMDFFGANCERIPMDFLTRKLCEDTHGPFKEQEKLFEDTHGLFGRAILKTAICQNSINISLRPSALIMRRNCVCLLG